MNESSMRRRAVHIWYAETDHPPSERLQRRLAALAWRLWARRGRSWMGALARLARCAREEATLFSVEIEAVVLKRGWKLAKRRPRERVVLYRAAALVTPDQLAGYGFRPSAQEPAAERPSTETQNLA